MGGGVKLIKVYICFELDISHLLFHLETKIWVVVKYKHFLLVYNIEQSYWGLYFPGIGYISFNIQPRNKDMSSSGRYGESLIRIGL